MPEEKKSGSVAEKLSLISAEFKPDKSMTEITSCEVIPFKDMGLNTWLVGEFLRTESRKARNKETVVLVFKHKNGREFAVGESAVLQSALLKAGAERIEGTEKVDYTAIVGKTIAIQNLGSPEGKRYTNLRVFVQE